jgi:predicted PurR-regulated permease PerM
MENTKPESSPRWSGTAKMVVALLAGAVLVFLLFRFKGYLAPLLLSFLLAYIFHPLASLIHRKLKLPWRLVSTIIFLLLFLIVLGLITWGGISIVDQVQNLVAYLQKLFTDLPGFIDTISAKPVIFGPFTLDFSTLDLNTLWTQLQGVVQPILTNLASLIGSIASGAASTLVGLIFIILVAYFIMVESDGVRSDIIKFTVPAYQDDIRRMGTEVGRIWNAFFRGQLIVITITVIFYSILLATLGVKYFFLLALLAGLARLVPYAGPFIAWTTYALVALFQTNYLGLHPFGFALVVVGSAWISDVILDNFVSPRVMSNALKVHPAAVLVMVIISGSLFGFIGVLLSAPILATLKLIFNYIFRKMMDLDPWEGLDTFSRPESISHSFGQFWAKLRSLFRKKVSDKSLDKSSLNDESNKNNEE